MLEQHERLGRHHTRLLMAAILFAAAVVVGVQMPVFAASTVDVRQPERN